MPSTVPNVLTTDNLIVAPALITHWRNRIVHESKSHLNKSEKSLLRESEQEIHATYKHLSVDRLLAHFEEGRPSLKDVSSLIAMSINLARRIDQQLGASITQADLDRLIQYYGLLEPIQTIQVTTTPSKIDASVDRVFKSLAPQLLEAYRQFNPYRS